MNENCVMKNQPIITGRGLCRHYRRGSEVVRALDGVDIEIRPSEAVCILGPSGSGKTTLINLLSALDSPTDGELFIDGRAVHGLTENELVAVRRGVIGYVFQQFHLIPTLTVSDNILLPALFLGQTIGKSDLGRVLDDVGLLDRANHYPSELSGGQMQRVAIGRALIVKPRVLIADEPTGNLDRQTGRTVFDLFMKSVRNDGIALVLTTHNLELSRLCDRVITLQDGKIKAQAGD